MATMKIDIGEGETRLSVVTSSWFAKDTKAMIWQFLTKIEQISIKDLVDLRVVALKEEHQKEKGQMYDKIERMKNDYQTLIEEHRELERRKS